LAENHSRPVSRRQAIRTALAAVFGATVGASIGGSSGGVDSDAYVQKLPTVMQEILHQGLSTPFSIRDALSSLRWQWSGSTQNIRVGNIEAESPSFFSVEDVLSAQTFTPFAYSGGSRRWVFGALENVDPATFSKGIDFVVNSSLSGGTVHSFTATSEQGTGASSSLFGAGASIGLPAGTQGTLPNTLCAGGHRHGFNGRFLGAQATYPISANAGLPINIARIKINNNWTLRRIWVFTNTGPTGGTETYALVNAAGAVQGTAVILPAGPGVAQAESALQVTNLTGATLYYLAQTAVGAGWLAASGNVEVGFEYTMNV